MGSSALLPRAAGAILGATLLAGCTGFSSDGGFGVVSTLTDEHLEQSARWIKDEPDRQRAREDVSDLLEGTLTAEKAMQIALLNNASLQAAYANLGMTEADWVQAGRLPNPGFRFEKTTGGGAREIERGLEFNVMAFLTLPLYRDRVAPLRGCEARGRR